MKKITPISSKTFNASVSTYEQVFSDTSWYVNAKAKARGIHDVIANVFENDIADKKVLDLGCGYGRMSFLAGYVAKEVVGVDFIQEAIDTANSINKYYHNNSKVKFYCNDAESYSNKGYFDTIILSGTLEHIISDEKLMNSIVKNLKSGGSFITDSPSEFNFRGMIHGGLWKLLDYPMTLSDVRIVTPTYIKQLFEKHGLQFDNNCVGTLLSRGWGPAGWADMIDRLKNVQTDLQKKDVLDKLNINNFDPWFKEALNISSHLLQQWYDEGRVKLVKPFKNRSNFLKSEKIRKELGETLSEIYMEPDFSIDPYYTTDSILSLLSGNIIYRGIKK